MQINKAFKFNTQPRLKNYRKAHKEQKFFDESTLNHFFEGKTSRNFDFIKNIKLAAPHDSNIKNFIKSPAG